MKSLVLHPGTQYSHRLVNQLNRVNVLQKFITGIAFTGNEAWLRVLPNEIRKKLSNRIFQGTIDGHQLMRIPGPELKALIQLRKGKDMETVIHARNTSWQNQIPIKELQSGNNIIGFDTSSWIIAEKAKQIGKPFFLDQSIAHPREKEKIFKTLRTIYPSWSNDVQPKDESQVELEELEYALSGKIIVASTFTKQSLLNQGVSSEKIVVNPYGVGPEFFKPKNKVSGGKVRFLYMGILGARKGLPLLLDAWKEYELFTDSELWLAGPASDHAKSEIENIPGIVYKGKVPFNDVPALVAACDCLVFPSFFEGFGQVILEAMASGLPVITTTATAGPDIIEHEKDGFILAPGDKKALGETMQRVARDRAFLSEAGSLSVDKARSFNWDSYGDRWKKIIDT